MIRSSCACGFHFSLDQDEGYIYHMSYVRENQTTSEMHDCMPRSEMCRHLASQAYKNDLEARSIASLHQEDTAQGEVQIYRSPSTMERSRPNTARAPFENMPDDSRYDSFLLLKRPGGMSKRQSDLFRSHPAV